MWHRLDRVLGGRRAWARKSAQRCEACGGPLGPDPYLVIGTEVAGEPRRVCSPECCPALWKKMVSDRQKLSADGEEPGGQRP
jgi:hypothetical protein